MLLDGEHLIEEALASGLAIEVAAFSERLATSSLVRRLNGSSTKAVIVSSTVLNAISPVQSPSGAVAIARRPRASLDRVFTRTPQLILMLHDLQDPGNVGAIVRAAEACGATGIVCGDTVIAAGARDRGAITVVDSTFATPLRQRPLELGADIVMHSATKFIGGHSDLLMGAAVVKDDGHATFLARHRHDHGAVPGALEAFLALRGLRTLAVRLDRSEASAVELAARLAAHPHVSNVHYAALPDDPFHAVASRVLPTGCGPMLSFDVAGTVEQTDAFLAGLRLVTHATSLGGVESLIERRARYAGDAAVVGATLCRLSVGIENVEDVWSDLDGALRAAFG